MRSRHLSIFVLLMIPLIIVVSVFPALADHPATVASMSVDNNRDQETEEQSGDPGFPGGSAVSYMVGHTLLEQGDAQEAFPYLRYAYHENQNELSIGLTYIRCLVALNELDPAILVLDSLNSIYPDNQELQMTKVRLLGEKGHYQRALDVFDQIEDSRRSTVELLMIEGGLLVQLDRVAEAITVYRRGLSLHPAQAEQFYLMLAALYQQQDRQEELTRLLREAVAALPLSNSLRLGLLGQLVYQDQIPEAIEMAREGMQVVAQADPEQIDYDTPSYNFLLELADICTQQSRFPEAAEILLNLFGAEQLDLESSLWLGRLLLAIGRGQEALEILPAINDRWPDSGRSYFLWGRALSDLGNDTLAIEKMRQAVATEPDVAEYRIGLLRSLIIVNQEMIASSDSGQQVEQIRAEISEHTAIAAGSLVETDSQGHLVLGFAQRLLDDLDEAAKHFEIASRNENDRLVGWLQLALCREDQGRRREAKEILTKLWQEYPDDHNVANSLSYLLAVLDEDLDFAESLIKKSLQADSENAAYLDTYGWILYQQGHYQAAFDQLVLAANAAPENSTILEHLGLVLKALGQDDRALEVLRRCLALGADAEHLTEVIAELEKKQLD